MRIYLLENDHKYHEVLDNIKSHVDEYKDEERKNVSSLAWNFLSIALSDDFGIEMEREEILFNNLGKPYFNSNNAFFNISHSEDLVAIIIAHYSCGIDIEKRIEDKNLSKRILSKFERFVYALTPFKKDYLSRVWVKKEAIAKKHGTSASSMFSETVSLINTKRIKFNEKIYYYAFA